MKFGKKMAWRKILALVLAFMLSIPWSALAESAAEGNTTAEAAAETTGTTDEEEVPVTGKGNGEAGNIFSASGFLGGYTVSFYRVDPQEEEVPANNLIAEYSDVEFGSSFSEQVEELKKEYPQYADVEWTIEEAEITNNLVVWAASEEAAQIGEETYLTLQAAIDAIKAGGAKGNEILLLRDVEENISSESVDYTLDMQGHTVSAPTGSTTRVYTISGGTVILKNGTITGGNTSTSTNYGAGLAILAGANVTADKLVITENKTINAAKGGGLYINASTASMTNCTVSGNVSENDNGGIFLENGAALTADYLQVSGNSAQGSGTWGAGISLEGAENSHCTLKLTNSSISGNSATGSGGGIYMQYSDLEITDSQIEGNTSGINGGGIGMKNGTSSDSSIVLKNVSLTGNTADSGGGIFSIANYFYAKDLIVKNNLASNPYSSMTSSGGATLRGAGSITLINAEISDNTAAGGVGGLTVSAGAGKNNPGAFYAKGCTISQNTGGAYGSGVYVSVQDPDETGEFEECSFTDNRIGSTIYIDGNDIKLTNCRIEGNDAGKKEAGAVYVKNCMAFLTDTVVTGNVGTQTGGIMVVKTKYMTNIHMSGGALYGNIASDGSGANDLKLQADCVDSDTLVPKASDMEDGAQVFEGYVWKDTAHSIKVETELDSESLDKSKILSNGGTYPTYYDFFYFTAGPASRYVAEVVEEGGDCSYYESVAEALASEAWEEGNKDIIRLIAGETDHSGIVIPEEICIEKGMNVSIDMNGRTLKGTTGSAVCIEEGATLTLSGDGGTILAGGSAAALTNEGTLIVEAPAVISGIDHKGEQLVLAKGVEAGSIKLAKGACVTAGEGFVPEALTLEIDEGELSALKNWKNAGAEDEVVVTLVVPVEGSTLADDLSGKISIKGANGFVIVEKDEATGNIVARTLSLNGVYLDGVDGDDNNAGTHDRPVKTFARAKEVLQELLKEQQEADGSKSPEGIYVLNTVQVSGSEKWTLDDELKDMRLMREPEFLGALVRVEGSNASLALSDITIDGMGDKAAASGSLVEVSGKATLTISEGALLTNNNRTTGYGGAVFASGATVAMTGGEISGNRGLRGGGVGLSGSSMTISDGSITENEAEESGGGVGVFKDSSLTVNGGKISNNTAHTGAGISVGGDTTVTVGTGDGKLIMEGGEISGNIAGAAGGGIYIQCQNTAVISAGTIANNTSEDSMFGGGGIYVNGTRSVGLDVYQYGTLYITNAIITGNSADIYGGGIAGCSTSTVNVYRKNGAYIYGNTGQGGVDEIFISRTLATLGSPDYFITEYMPDGTPYFWSNRQGEPVASGLLHDTHETIYLDSEAVPAAAAQASVLITGNSSGMYGGGIGTNGVVVIGEEDGTEIKVTKTWDDSGREDNRPDYVDIWLLRDGERVAFLRFQEDSDGIWQETLSFVDQPLSDGNGHTYTYTLEEEMPEKEDGGAYPYTATVEGNASDGFTVCNTYTAAGSWTPKGTKALKGRAMEAKEFAFTVTEDGVKVSEGVNQAAPAESAADIVFDEISYSLEDVGEHSYFIEEVQTGLPAGVTADSGRYMAAVTVTDKGDGSLEVSEQYSLGGTACETAAFTNTYEKEKITVSFDKRDADSGIAVKGAVLRVVDMDGRKIDEWTSNGEPHTISGILEGGADYRLIEVKAPDGYQIAEDIIFNVDAQSVSEPIVMKDEKKEEHAEHGAVKVTKKLTLNGESIGAVDQTFYVALYEDEECTKRVTEIMPVTFQHASESEVIFDDLEVGKTYYVGECDSNGDVIYSGIVGSDTVFMPTFANGNAAKAEKNNDTAEVEFCNELFSIPSGFYKECELVVTKKVLGSDGNAKESSETFYAGIFADAACTVLTDRALQNVVALNMGGGAQVSQSVTVEYVPGQEVTLYVAEVDADGNLVEGSEGFLYSISYDAQSVTYHDNQLKNAVTITNAEMEEAVTEIETETEEEETEKATEKTTEKTTEKQVAKTGDQTSIMRYLILLGAAGAVLLVYYRRRRMRS